MVEPDDTLPDDPTLPDEGEVGNTAVAEDDPEELDETEEGEQPDEPDDDEPQVEAAAKKSGRANDRIRTLREAARVEKERADKVQREVEELRASRIAEQRAAELAAGQVSAQEEAYRVSMMTDDEKLRYQLDKLAEQQAQMAREQQRQMEAIKLREQDLVDRQAFDGLISKHPPLKKYAATVDEELARLRAQGGNAPREAALYYFVGKATVEAMGKTGQDRARAASNLRREFASPPNGGSDVSTSNRRSKVDIEEVEW